MRIAIGIGLAGFLVLIGLLLYSPVFFLNITIKRMAAKDPADAAPAPCWLDGRGGEPVSLVSFDGLILRGIYIPALPSSGRTVILAHGYRGVGRELSDYARFFYEKLGYNLLIPDARSHGASEGTYIGFGWLERLDYLRWIDWAKERTAGAENAGIVLFGVSMGAATVMMTAGEELPREVRAVIEDCGYTSAVEEIRHVMRTRYHLSSPLLLTIAGKLVKKRAGYAFEEASSIGQVRKAKVPILFIHGDADTFVPSWMVYPLYEACGSEKELYVVKGAGHTKAYTTDPALYERRVSAFLEKYVP
ncbi:MAG: alpha/beta hydrolase [Treponema sp.]|jgi:fermentation-respiration switch protein FrsA (DUF1100 family)|nr:alpha/beta hydrolase [Treponema sp.]